MVEASREVLVGDGGVSFRDVRSALDVGAVKAPRRREPNAQTVTTARLLFSADGSDAIVHTNYCWDIGL